MPAVTRWIDNRPQTRSPAGAMRAEIDRCFYIAAKKERVGTVPPAKD